LLAGQWCEEEGKWSITGFQLLFCFSSFCVWLRPSRLMGFFIHFWVVHHVNGGWGNIWEKGKILLTSNGFVRLQMGKKINVSTTLFLSVTKDTFLDPHHPPSHDLFPVLTSSSLACPDGPRLVPDRTSEPETRETGKRRERSKGAAAAEHCWGGMPDTTCRLPCSSAFSPLPTANRMRLGSQSLTNGAPFPFLGPCRKAEGPNRRLPTARLERAGRCRCREERRREQKPGERSHWLPTSRCAPTVGFFGSEK
jgi:hypothetical protein